MARALKEKWFPPSEPTDSFSGQVILVTGASTGLGYEAARKLVQLDAHQVIITARSQQRADQAKQSILSALPANARKDPSRILPLVLDMSSAAGVQEFTQTLKSHTDKLDAAILNAGTLKISHSKSPEGYEETIQVNAISTMLLATEILPLLKRASATTSRPAHLTFVSSRMSTNTSNTKLSGQWTQSTPITEWSKPENFPSGITGGQSLYARSKLLLEYSIRRLIQLPYLQDNSSAKGSVIVNSVCPGVVSTDLGRDFHDKPMLVALASVFQLTLGKSPDKGANCYISALLLGPESTGQMWTASEQFEPAWDAVKSENGKTLGDAAWREMQQILLQTDPTLGGILRGD